VQSNGNLLIGSAYTKQLDLKPGDEFEISLGHKASVLNRWSKERLRKRPDIWKTRLTALAL